MRAVIEAELQAAFALNDEPDPVPALLSGTTNVYFHDSHDFEDDRDFTATRYRYWISVHDSTRNEERQLAIAQRIFDAAMAQAWPVMLSFNLQDNIAVYP